MRPLPVLLLVLGVAAGAALGLRVMQDAGAPRTAPAVSTGAANHGAVPQGHVYAGCAPEPQNVNPLTVNAPLGRRLVLAHTHDTLLEVDPHTDELRPSLAERFEPAADGASCTFTLRSGVRFSDGTPLTMDDVLFGWELASAGHADLGYVDDAFARLDRVERLDDRRFRVHFRERHYAALRVVGESWLVAQRRFFVDRVAARLAPAEAPPVQSTEFATALAQIERECGPGTGPYVLENAPGGVQRWQQRQELLLVRNEHSWRRAADPGTWNFAGIRVLFRDGPGTDNALLRRDIDWYTLPKVDAMVREHPTLADDYQRFDYDYPASGLFRVAWQCRSGPCADAGVRRALRMLFDTDAIVAALHGGATPALAYCWPGSAAYPRDLQPIRYDPAVARAALREHGYDAAAGRPLRLVVLVLQGTEGVMRKIADAFEDAARQAGVELDLRRLDPTAFTAEKQAGGWHGVLWMQRLKPWEDPYELVHSQGVDNDGGFAHAEVDRLAATARAEFDPARREQLWRELHAIVHREQPAAFLVYPRVSMLLARRIQGAFIGRHGLVLERAFVAPDRQRK
jgi:peptide/nickel transport system substrate-binding protein